MIYSLFFVLELFTLFFLSQQFSRSVSRLLLRITRSETMTIQGMSLLFLPGVILHELAHWFVAGMLLVPTGEMEFMPQIQGNTVKLGSVAVGKTDPFRRFLIGVAPVLIGLAVMFGLFAYFSSVIPQINWQTGVVFYLFFEIGNTMFSSKKDMEGALFLLGFLVFLAVVYYFLGFRIHPKVVISFFSQPSLVSFFQKADGMLLFPLVINTFLCVPSWLLKK